jgi:CHAT domain-containing protein/Tfp pilus assembly protein PilF
MFTLTSLIAHPLYIFHHVTRRSLSLLITLSLLTSLLAAQTDQGVLTLEPGKPVTRELTGSQTHSYQIPLSSGQYVYVAVDQQGIDVVVSLLGPDGKPLVEVDSPNGAQGPENVFTIAETSGTYRLVVQSLEKNAAPGRYEVKVVELRTATEQDKNLLAATRTFTQAESLRAQGTAQSVRLSIKKYEESLPLWRAAGKRNAETATLLKIGEVYLSLGEPQQAEDKFTQALSLWQATKDQRSEAATLVNIGLIYEVVGERKQALKYLEQASSLWRAIGERSEEALTLGNMGRIYYAAGESEKALDHYTQALTLYQATTDRRGQAVTLTRIGMVYDLVSDYQKALEKYTQALSLWRAIGDRRGESAALSNMGIIYDSLGEKQKALEALEQALLLDRAIGDRGGEATTLDSIGKIYGSIGEKQKALESFLQALTLYRAVGEQRGEAATLTDIGLFYDSVGEQKQALKYLEQAQPIWRAAGDRVSEASGLNNLGMVYNSMGEKQKALDKLLQALALYRAVGDRGGEATALNNIGGVYNSMGDQKQALKYFEQALPIWQSIGERRGEAATLGNIGEGYSWIGEHKQAMEKFLQALPLYQDIGDRDGEAKTIANLALVNLDQGNLVESRKRIEETLSIIETLRTKIASQELRSSYFATTQDYYEFYINLLMRQHKQQPSAGYDGEALQASERARARSLLELLNEARVDIRQGVDSGLVEREQSLQQKLNDRAKKQAQLLRGPYTATQATALAKEIEEIITEHQQVEAQINQASPRYAALSQPQPLTFRDIQTKVLDANTLLLEYSLGKYRSYLWAVTPTSITSYELPKRVEVEAVAKKFHDLLAAPDAANKSSIQRQEMSETASRLSQILLGPVASQLGQKRILVVANGALQYIPFAALPDPAAIKQGPKIEQHLIMQHEIVSLPSISILPTLRSELEKRLPAPQTITILADPVFSLNDKRVKKATVQKSTGQPKVSSIETDGLIKNGEVGTQEVAAEPEREWLDRLPSTRKEAQQILTFVPTNKGKLALDFNASRAFAVSGELSKYRHVLFATHGRLDDLHPDLSSIVLSLVDERGNSQNGYLRLNEIYNLQLRADLVTLSGCETGLGKEIRGEGLVGLTRGFMYAGAARIVVSLWKVDDEATAELMIAFYRGILKEGKRPAEALRAAQTKMMEQEHWQSPHYWAAFVLQGEWK